MARVGLKISLIVVGLVALAQSVQSGGFTGAGQDPPPPTPPTTSPTGPGASRLGSRRDPARFQTEPRVPSPSPTQTAGTNDRTSASSSPSPPAATVAASGDSSYSATSQASTAQSASGGKVPERPRFTFHKDNSFKLSDAQRRADNSANPKEGCAYIENTLREMDEKKDEVDRYTLFKDAIETLNRRKLPFRSDQPLEKPFVKPLQNCLDNKFYEEQSPSASSPSRTVIGVPNSPKGDKVDESKEAINRIRQEFEAVKQRGVADPTKDLYTPDAGKYASKDSLLKSMSAIGIDHGQHDDDDDHDDHEDHEDDEDDDDHVKDPDYRVDDGDQDDQASGHDGRDQVRRRHAGDDQVRYRNDYDDDDQVRHRHDGPGGFEHHPYDDDDYDDDHDDGFGDNFGPHHHDDEHNDGDDDYEHMRYQHGSKPPPHTTMDPALVRGIARQEMAEEEMEMAIQRERDPEKRFKMLEDLTEKRRLALMRQLSENRYEIEDLLQKEDRLMERFEVMKTQYEQAAAREQATRDKLTNVERKLADCESRPVTREDFDDGDDDKKEYKTDEKKALKLKDMIKSEGTLADRCQKYYMVKEYPKKVTKKVVKTVARLKLPSRAGVSNDPEFYESLRQLSAELSQSKNKEARELARELEGCQPHPASSSRASTPTRHHAGPGHDDDDAADDHDHDVDYDDDDHDINYGANQRDYHDHSDYGHYHHTARRDGPIAVTHVTTSQSTSSKPMHSYVFGRPGSFASASATSHAYPPRVGGYGRSVSPPGAGRFTEPPLPGHLATDHETTIIEPTIILNLTHPE